RVVWKATPGGRQGLAALVHRPRQHLSIGCPFVKEANGRRPVAGALFQLAEVQTYQGVGIGLTPLVAQLEQPFEERARLFELTTPSEALPCDPLRGLGQGEAGIGDGAEPPADVVDRMPSQTSCPGEGVERELLRLR